MKSNRKILLTAVWALVTWVGSQSGDAFAQTSNPASPRPSASGSDVGSTTNPYSYNGINQTPWFANPMVRRELNLDDARYNQLSQGYGQAWNRYNQGMAALDPNLPSGRWAQQQQELTNEFHRNFGQQTNTAFADQTARDRYNQLYLQYRGYSAFTDPAVQQSLNLTPQQVQIFTHHNADWNTRMQRWETQYPNNPQAVQNAFDSYARSYQQNLNSALTPQQSMMWNTMTGSRFDFPADYYFQNNATGTPANPGNSLRIQPDRLLAAFRATGPAVFIAQVEGDSPQAWVSVVPEAD